MNNSNSNSKQMLNEIQIYVNNYSNGYGDHEYSHILLANQKNLDDGGNFNGCAIRDSRSKKGIDCLGYYEGYNPNFYRPLRNDEQIDFNVYGDSTNGGDHGMRLIREKTKYSYMPFRDLLIVPSNRNRKSCIVDLTYGSFISMDKYFRNNPLKLKLFNKGKKGFKLHKKIGQEDILISDKESDGWLSGCRLCVPTYLTDGKNVDGYSARWNEQLFEEVSNVEMEISYDKVEVRGNKILVDNGRMSGVRDCIIDIGRGTITPTELSSYRRDNPLIITLKNKKC